MSSARLRGALAAAALIAPLLAFLVVFFLWPLLMMVSAAIYDGSTRRALPEVAASIGSWSAGELPPPEVFAALVADLRTSGERAEFGDTVRRLNSDIPGFRTLLTRSASSVRQAPAGAPVNLVAIDPRWGTPAYWQAIRRSLSPLTDKNLLASLDLTRSPDGEIVSAAAESSAHRRILWRTFQISASVTALCAVLGLPYAMLMAATRGWVRTVLVLAVLLPLWTSLLVRTAAWVILLQNEGLVNDGLQAIGVIGQPLALIYNRAGVIIAMTHVLLPFMVMPIYTVLLGIPANLMPAAASLGAPPLLAFWRVLLPLSIPGVLSGSLLVFMAALGYYITPALVGGADDQMISSVIAFYATGTANWGLAGALGIVLLLSTIALYMIYGRISRSPALPGV